MQRGRIAWPARRRGRGLLLALLAPVLVVVASCGTTTQRPAQTAPVWTPSGSAHGAAGEIAPGDWTRFGYDAARSGVNPLEAQITASTVAGLHRLWRVQLPSNADSSPILLHAVALPDGTTRDVLYVTTLDGRLIALDGATGQSLWSQRPLGPKITNSSPVADGRGENVYVYGLDGALHKYVAATGAEFTGHGWPARITRMVQTEKESSAINIVANRIYVATSGYIGDAPPYQGHIVVVDASTGATTVFNSL